MSIANFCLKRPVTIIMVMVFIMLFGTIAIFSLPQELFPPITYPQLTVVTSYANAAPEEIETLITKPIEESVGTVAGIKRVKSISREGLSLVMAEFGWNENMDFASLKLREKIDLIKERLPRESGEPLVMKYNPFDKPIMILNVTGKRSPLALRELTRKMIKDELEKVEGVASASITGGLEREILVEIDGARLVAQNIPIMDVVNAITNSNMNYPAGTIKESFYEYLVRTMGEFEKVREINDVPVKTAKKNEGNDRGEEGKEQRDLVSSADVIMLKDVATVSDTYKDRTSYSRYNGKENISVAVQKQAQANILQVVTRVKNALKTLETELPPDIEITIINDQSKFIKNAIANVRDNAWQGAILAFFVLFVFLRNFWTALVVIMINPPSIWAVFVAMYFNNISLNIMSLGGLALGVGMLLDNAIVILENISRHRDLGEPVKEASVNGATEVTGALFASTLTQISVFFPMVFIVGIAAQLFKQIAFTIVYAQIISLFVAMTLVPLLISWVKDVKVVDLEKESYVNSPFLVSFEKIIRNFLKHRKLGFMILLAFLGLAILGFMHTDKELMPKADQGQFTIKINMPAGTKVEATNRIAERIESLVLKLPEINDVSTMVGSTLGKGAEDVLQRLGSYQAEISVTMLPNHKIKTKDVVQMIEDEAKDVELEGGKVEYLLSETSFSAGMEGSSPIMLEVKGKDMEIMMGVVGKVQNTLKDIKGVYNVKTDMPERAPETKIIVDKDKAALYQLSVMDIAQTTQVALKGYISSEFKEKGQEVDIRVRLREIDRDDFNKLSQIQISTPNGVKVQLSNLVNMQTGRGPNEIKRVDQERTIIISADLFKRALKDAVADINKRLKKLDIPKDYTVKIAGETEEMKESFNSMIGALILSLTLVYMIMAGQFESFIQPFIIMFTVPFSVIGVIFALVITGTSLNVIVFLGIIMLAGIAVNNGIVLVDYINLLLSRGVKVDDAVVEASKTRLRPILMTAFSSMIGMVPMAFARGEGSELSSPLGVTVIGGICVTTLLSVFFIPALYLTIHHGIQKLFKR